MRRCMKSRLTAYSRKLSCKIADLIAGHKPGAMMGYTMSNLMSSCPSLLYLFTGHSSGVNGANPHEAQQHPAPLRPYPLGSAV